MTVHRTPFRRFGSLLGLLAGIVLWTWLAPLGAAPRASAAAWSASPSHAPGPERAPASPSSEPETDDDEIGDDLLGVSTCGCEVAPADQIRVGHIARSLEPRAGHSILPERPPRG